MTSPARTLKAARSKRRRAPASRLRIRVQACGANLRAMAPEAGRFTLALALTILLFTLIFPPREIWILAFVCLAPWTYVVCRTQRAWLVHWLSFLGGWVFYLINVSWLMPVTGLGYAVLGFYLAMYWPLAAWAIRTGRRAGISPVWTLPVVWVACEYLRALVMSGFPWLFVGHAFYRQLALIQISDVTGAYGVSFLALLVNGAFVELLLVRRLVDGKQPRRRRAVVGVLVATTVVIGALLYGRVRIADSSFEQGPRIAVVQEDFPLRTDSYDQPELMFARYAALGARAAAEKPDLLVFPETAWNAFQNIGFVEVEHHAVDEVGAYRWSFASKCHASIAALARGDYRPINAQIALWESLFRRVAPQRRELELPTDLPRLPTDRGPAVAVVVGAVSVETFPEATYPKSKRYNSALLYDKDGTQRRQRYDKNHLVPFGEAVPFRYGRLHWLYRRLNELSPFSGLDGTHEYSLTPGDELTVFELSTERGTVRFGTPICYEDVMPYLVRHYVWDGDQKRVDFLVNISNDGWFLHSAELPQHLAICVFRAVENRVGIARAVNTGISGFIDPNGRIYSLVEKEGRAFGEGIIGYSVDHVMIDRRASLYGRFGDVFARACLILSVPLWIGAVFTRWVLALRRRVARLLSKGGV